MSSKRRSERPDDTTRSEYMTVTDPPPARSPGALNEQATTTVRCAIPEDAAATLRVTGAQGRGPRPTQKAGGRFADEGEIARGGMSVVRRVLDNLLLRRVAMKELAHDMDFDDMARFIEEAQITGQLDHPNIVPVYDLEMDEDGLPTRFTMKLVHGRTLHELLHPRSTAADGGPGLEELLDIFLKICDAVAFAHNRGVVHRDIKPSNVMIGDYGQVYLMDWGVAMIRHGMRPSEARQSLATIDIGSDSALQEPQGSLTGTPAYMAPEQALGLIDAIDERTDVYGLGGLLYQFLTRRPPHDGSTPDEDLLMAKGGEVPHPTEVVQDIVLPPGLCRIAMRALAAAPEDRYETVDELRREVEAFRRGGGWFASEHYPAGTTIIAEGDRAQAAYIITEGQCELRKKVGGEDRFVRLLAAGEAFGETAIFSDIARTASVVAANDVTVLVVTRDALERELDRNTWMRSFVEAITERFLELDRRVVRLDEELAQYRDKDKN